MIINIVFPLADNRRFSEVNTGKLPLPNWPSPIVYQDFVRSSGQVRERSKGGIAGWVGECSICNARQMIKLMGPPVFVNKYSPAKPPVLCTARHFYFDGTAVGKLEIVFRISDPLWMSTKSIQEILHQILDLKVKIQIPSGETRQTKLSLAAGAIAQKYTYSSTFTRDYSLLVGKRWVSGGQPIIFITMESFEDQVQGIPLRNIRAIENLGLRLNRMWQIEGGSRFQVWMMTLLNNEDRTKTLGRSLRLFLTRLNVEYACLRFVIRALATGEISPQPGSEASKLLGIYLDETTRKISRMSRESKEHYQAEEIEQIALATLDEVNPGERDDLLKSLKIANIQPQVLRKVEQIVNLTFIEEANFMRDQYNTEAGQVMNIGPEGHVHVHDVTFNQTWLDNQEKIDLPALAGELAFLRSKMKEEAKTPEQDIAVADVAMAEKSAKEGDGPKVIEYLKKAGKWTLDLAQKVGVNLATEALKIALGLKMP